MKILITGATGFLGSHSVEKFIDQHHIVILKRSFSDVWRISSLIDKLIVYDLDNLDLRCMFKKEKIEAIIHLATNYGRNTESALEIAHLVMNDHTELSVELLDEKIQNTNMSETKLICKIQP